MGYKIQSTGLTEVYKPSSPIVDIVFVHGLQGHPFRTWAQHQDQELSPAKHDSKKRGLLDIISRRRSKSPLATQHPPDTSNPKASSDNGGMEEAWLVDSLESRKTFWPGDNLPNECPDARILTWGYDTLVTKGFQAPADKTNIFGHGKKLLFALGRNRDTKRPIIFVAHSLGGIIVKEMLANSDASEDEDLKTIAESTAAVIFLGTPHRGSKDLASVGEVVRKAASIILDTSSASLDALGLRTSDLERCQEAFSRIWRRNDFRVKTFQESTGLSSMNIASLNEKVVPDISSTLGDSREQAEPLVGNHMQICRLSGLEDPNYEPIVGELRRMYSSIIRMSKVRSSMMIEASPGTNIDRVDMGIRDKAAESACLQSLTFPRMKAREISIRAPVAGTCTWLMENETYRIWRKRERLDDHLGLLFIKGNPGSGKSTIMKAALNQEQSKSDDLVIAFFFDAKGPELARTSLGFYRSVVYQLIKSNLSLRKFFVQEYQERYDSTLEPWSAVELQKYLYSMYEDPYAPSTTIFVDALDECGEDQARDIAYFLRDLTILTNGRGNSLNICLSSRMFPSITLNMCPEILMDRFNRHDIAIYVDNRLAISSLPRNWLRDKLRKKLIKRSSGVFLWVVLAMDTVLREYDQGSGILSLLHKVEKLPKALETLYLSMFLDLSTESRLLTVQLFQWTILAAKPLRLYEWHHILAFIRQPPPSSLRMWRESEYFTENDDQLEKQIRTISKGLVEVTSATQDVQGYGIETMSLSARAGSLDLEQGETRVVQVIHESVREFFQTRGFSLLCPTLSSNPIGNGHLSIIATCLDYLNITELDALVEARTRHHSVPSIPPHSEMNLKLKHPSENGIKGEDVEEEHYVDKAEELSQSELINISRWVETTSFAADHVSLEEFADASSKAISITRQSQLLEDHFALLMYATFKIFTHARLAEQNGADSSHVIERLMEEKTWTRWVALREDLPQGLAILDYAISQNLPNWAVKIKNDPQAASADALMYGKSKFKEPRTWNPKGRKLRGSSSLASFASAGTFSWDDDCGAGSKNDFESIGSTDDQSVSSIEKARSDDGSILTSESPSCAPSAVPRAVYSWMQVVLVIGVTLVLVIGLTLVNWWWRR